MTAGAEVEEGERLDGFGHENVDWVHKIRISKFIRIRQLEVG
jgi:hypothetical protein